MDTIEKFITEQHFIADPMEFQISIATWVKGYLVMNHRYLAALNLPEGVHAYPVRHSDDDDSVPATLENKDVVVNYYGLFLTTEDLDYMFVKRDYIEVLDWGFLDD